MVKREVRKEYNSGMRRNLLIHFLGGLIFSLMGPAAAFAGDPVVGTWRGTVDQPGWGSYEAVMTFDSAGGGTVQYPSLNCGGTLSGSGAAGAYNFTESITYGLWTPEGGGCVTGGSIRMVLEGDAAFWEWRGSHEGKEIYASGKLYREGPQVTIGNCGECGEALMNDIAYGFDPSQNFRNFVYEARQKYSNCIQAIPGACRDTCGRQLYDNLPTCESYDDPGHKACVETALNGARLSCP